MATNVLRVSFGAREDSTRPMTVLRFGDIVIDLAVREVRAGRRLSRIEPRAAAVLGVLIARAGQVVSREALLDTCWREAAGSDEALTQAVAQLRRALADDPRAPSCIATVSKGGYRWIAQSRQAAPRRWPIAAGFAGAALMGAGVTAVALSALNAPSPPRRLHQVWVVAQAGEPPPPLPPLPTLD